MIYKSNNMNVDSIKINKNASILQALEGINRNSKNSKSTLLVENDTHSIVGTITDGDIRRALLSGLSINDTIESVYNKDFSYIREEEHDFKKLKEFRDRGVRILPVLDCDSKLIRILDLKEIRSLLPVECMIMAGGRGARLSPLTDTIPKPMLLLGGKPIIEHNIDRLISYGIRNIYISVKYLGEQIVEYFGDGSSKGIEIKYIWEEEPLGTAGALSLIDKVESDYFLVMNSDLFTNVDFEQLYLDMIEHKADMVVSSIEYQVDIPYAVCEVNENKVTDFKEKPTYIYYSNAGIYMFRKELIKSIPKNTFYNITDLMEKLVKEGDNLIYSPIIGYWIDIGKPIDYKKAQEFIKHLE